jgi:uncharacterized membrane protein YqaE (UPF0057 family)
MKKILLVTASILFLVASCTVEKRVYRNGFNVQWHAMNGISKKDKQVEVNSEMEELATAQVINAPKANVTTASSYEATTNSVAQNDVASVDAAPVVIDTKAASNNIKGMAATTIQNNVSNNAVKHVSKQEMKTLRKALKTQNKSDDIPVGLLYVLCFFIPFVAVGLVTDWDVKEVIINLLLTFLCGIPGIIHAIIVVSRNS